MKRIHLALFLLLAPVAGALAALGCDSQEDPLIVDRSHRDVGGVNDDAGALDGADEVARADATGDATSDALADATADAAETRDPTLNCVKPGTPSNEAGVGGYCEKQQDCKSDAGPRICTSDFTTDPTAWFCTALCDVDGQCGVGAFCLLSDAGNGCVPYSCAPSDDAGSDADARGDGG